MSASALEDALNAEWYRDQDLYVDLRDSRLRQMLRVYSEQLRHEGNPRGELIKLDLEQDTSTEGRERRVELVAAWVGPELAKHPRIRTACGLLSFDVTDDDRGLIEAVLAGPGCRYVEAIDFKASRRAIQTGLEQMASAEHRWLGVLSLRVEPSDAEESSDPPSVDQSTITRLIAATPVLRLLEVSGSCLLSEFSHPSLKSLAVDGFDSIGSLSGSGSGFPSVEFVDLAIHRLGSRRDSSRETLQRLLPATHFPALRVLDLSRNVPGSSGQAERGDVSVFAFLRSLAARRQLQGLRIPSIRSRLEADDLQLALDGMPDLVELTVALSDGPRYQLRHPSARISVDRRPSVGPRTNE